jgi:WD40 repeat protein
MLTGTNPSLAIANRSQNRVPLQVLEEGRDSITSIKIQNHLICTGSVDGRVRTYDLRMGQLQIDLFDREFQECQLNVGSLVHAALQKDV